VRRRHEGGQSVPLTPSDEVDAAVDRRARKVVALCGENAQHLPAVGPRVVDGEVASARRASTRDVDLAIVRNSDAGTASRRHAGLLDPCTLSGIQFVDCVHVGGGISHGLAADQVDLSVRAGGHPVVVGLRERRSELPATARDVVDLDGTRRLPVRGITAEEVEFAVQFGERQLGVRFDQ
jgi:hypothetical protein